MKAQSIQKIASDWTSSQSPCTQTLHTKQQLIYRPAEGGSHNDSAEYILLFHFVTQVTGWVQNPYASSNIGTISPEWWSGRLEVNYFLGKIILGCIEYSHFCQSCSDEQSWGKETQQNRLEMCRGHITQMLAVYNISIFTEREYRYRKEYSTFKSHPWNHGMFPPLSKEMRTSTHLIQGIQ